MFTRCIKNFEVSRERSNKSENFKPPEICCPLGLKKENIFKDDWGNIPKRWSLQGITYDI